MSEFQAPEISNGSAVDRDQARDTHLVVRFAILITLAALELPFLAFLYDPLSINNISPAWLQARVVLREFVPMALFFLAAFAVVVAPRWRVLADQWLAAARDHNWRLPLIVNVVLFVLLAFATLQLNAWGATQDTPPWGLFFLWSATIAGAYGVLLAAAAPVSFWQSLLKNKGSLIALAGGGAIVIEAAALLSRQSWNFLSEATFRFSTWILSLYEQNIMTIPEERIIGIGAFKVNIAAACSGYEGIGLVLTFLAIYLWVFRAALRFPNAYIVLPIGVAAIWILNSVRIAALVSLGAHVSPEIAITGFHSQAGWMMFLVVTIGIMFATHNLSFFKTAQPDAAPLSHGASEATALLAPFLAMTAAGIIAAAFGGQNFWLYGLRVAALAIAITVFWRHYQKLDWRISWEPVVLGLIVGAVWIATDPGKGVENTLGPWLNTLSTTAAAAWIALRLAGTVLLVPVAEELAFRGYLHRKLIADKFETVAEGAFSWKALLISSALFGVLHDRWLAGALAGAVFALALYRSGKVTGAITAHISANALIAFWAIVFGQWSLL